MVSPSVNIHEMMGEQWKSENIICMLRKCFDGCYHSGVSKAGRMCYTGAVFVCVLDMGKNKNCQRMWVM